MMIVIKPSKRKTNGGGGGGSKRATTELLHDDHRETVSVRRFQERRNSCMGGRVESAPVCRPAYAEELPAADPASP